MIKRGGEFQINTLKTSVAGAAVQTVHFADDYGRNALEVRHVAVGMDGRLLALVQVVVDHRDDFVTIRDVHAPHGVPEAVYTALRIFYRTPKEG